MVIIQVVRLVIGDCPPVFVAGARCNEPQKMKYSAFVFCVASQKDLWTIFGIFPHRCYMKGGSSNAVIILKCCNTSTEVILLRDKKKSAIIYSLPSLFYRER